MSGRGGLGAVLALYLAVACAFNVVNPVFEAPDESSHAYFAQLLAHGGGLPVQPAEPDARGPWEQEGSQPPLYYLLAAVPMALAGGPSAAPELWINSQNTMGHPALTANENRFVHRFTPGAGTACPSPQACGSAESPLIPVDDIWPWRGYTLGVHGARLLGTLLGVLTVAGVWAVARRALPGRPALWASAAAVAGLNPQFAYLSASVSNDTLIICLATLSLALTLRLAEGAGGTATLIALAVAAGAAPLAKLSGLAVLGFVAISLVGIGWRRGSWRFGLGAAGLVLVTAAVGAGWWYAQNARLYGDFTGLSHMLPEGTRRAFRLGSWVRGLPAELRGLWLSTWGLFGWFTVLMPAWWYRVVDLAGLAGVLGLAWAALQRRGAPVRWGVVAWLGAWLVVVGLSLLRWMTIAKGAQGRLLFPALAALAVGLVVGWRAVAPARLRDGQLAVVIAGTMLALSVLAVREVRAAYAHVPAGAVAEGAPAAVFGAGLALQTVAHPAGVMAGDSVPVTLTWRALAPLAADGVAAVRFELPTRDGLAESAAISYPGRGALPPPLMAPGDAVKDVVDVPVPAADVPYPVLARLSVHVFDPTTGKRWRLGSGETEWPSPVVVRPRTPPEVPAELRATGPQAEFAGGAQLYAAVSPTAPRMVHMAWVAGAAAPAGAPELSAWIHVVDAAGNVLATLDRTPANPPLPTSLWRPGDVTVNEVPLPDVAGAAAVEIGLYDPVGGARVPAQAQGRALPGDGAHLSLETGP